MRRHCLTMDERYSDEELLHQIEMRATVERLSLRCSRSIRALFSMCKRSLACFCSWWGGSKCRQVANNKLLVVSLWYFANLVNKPAGAFAIRTTSTALDQQERDGFCMEREKVTACHQTVIDPATWRGSAKHRLLLPCAQQPALLHPNLQA